MRSPVLHLGAGLVAFGTLCVPAYATPTILQLTPSLASPQPLGTTVAWTTTATDTDPGALNYQYQVVFGSHKFMVRDFSLSSSFDLTLVEREGPYQIQVTVLNTSTSLTAQLAVPFQANSLIVGGHSVVTPTANPLVALLSAPSCPAGSFMRGLYLLQGSTLVQATYWKPCQAPASMNFYIAGMLASTKTIINYEVLTGTTKTFGPTALTFNSGPVTISVPAVNVLVPPAPQDDLALGMILHDYLISPPTATDLQGNIMWYYPGVEGQGNALLTRPLARGTMLLIVNGQNSSTSVMQDQVLREIDLAGNTLRETNATLVGQKLASMGVLHPGQIFTSFDHDAIRLPNGNTVAFGTEESIFPTGTQGSTDPLGVDIIGDVAVVLDANWQVIWGWNSYDHMDINRAAVLGETCSGTTGGCPPLILANQTSTNSANDWLHGNSLYYIQTEGDLLLSFRHQDWVVKVDYNNGAGTGNVLWRLGLGGDFTMTSTDPSPWFSHQHEAGFENHATTLISLFDNGDTRVADNPTLLENSRGQLINIDETTMQVSLRLNADLGVYGFALGSAQLLPNGNAHFQAGVVQPANNSYSIEVLPDGTISYEMQTGPSGTSYRSWRMANLYLPPYN